MTGIKQKWGLRKVVYSPVRVVGFVEEKLYPGEEIAGGERPGYVYLRTSYPAAHNHPDDVAAEREAGRRRAQILLRGGEIFDGTTLTEK